MQRLLVGLICVLASIASGCAQEPQQTSSANAPVDSDAGSSKPSLEQWDFVNEQIAEFDSDRPIAAGSDWTKFLGPQSNGTSPETGVDATLWNPHPPLNWVLPLGTSYGGPAIVGNRLLQFDRFGDSERLSCFDAKTAEELWRSEIPVEYGDMYGYNNGPRCAPIVDGELVYTYGVAGQLTCYQLATGKLVWTRDLNTEFAVVQNFFGVASSPYIYEDLILVMVGGSPASSKSLASNRLDLVEPNGTAIVAFDKKTGAERYRVGDDLASYASVSVEQINGQPTGLAFLRGGLLAFDPTAGTENFAFPWRSSKFESVNAAMPVVKQNQILLSECYEIGSVLLEVQDDGKPKLLRKDEGRYRELSFRAHWSTPVLVDGYLFGCSGRNPPDSDFRCVRFSDGELMWQDIRRERSSVLAIDDHLIVLNERGQLDLIKPSPEKMVLEASVDLNDLASKQDGAPLLQYPCWAAPIVSHGVLYVRGKNHLLSFQLIPN